MIHSRECPFVLVFDPNNRIIISNVLAMEYGFLLAKSKHQCIDSGSVGVFYRISSACHRLGCVTCAGCVNVCASIAQRTTSSWKHVRTILNISRLQTILIDIPYVCACVRMCRFVFVAATSLDSYSVRQPLTAECAEFRHCEVTRMRHVR